ncbi:MAG: hypothetical protein ABSF10_03705 [Verrucomicrobiota bacterium]
MSRRFDQWKYQALAKLLVFTAQPFTFRERVGESLFNGQTHLVKVLKSRVKRDSKHRLRVELTPDHTFCVVSEENNKGHVKITLIIKIRKTGGRGGIRTTFGSFFNFHYSATTTSLPEANSLITNERQ